MSRVLITGAGGFLGHHLVWQARRNGLEVLALTRGAGDPLWDADMGIKHARVDLGSSESACLRNLTALVADTDTVIHAAASFAGDAAAHARDTVRATDNLLQALSAAILMPRLVLVSSLSVYNVADMADHETLDENSPLVQDAVQRDAYAAAKAEQERMAVAASSSVQIVRPGALFGPGRLWSAQLGFARAGVVICPGGNSLVPAIHVSHAAEALLRACALDRIGPAINLVSPSPPSQAEWIEALDMHMITVPLRLVLAAGRRLGRSPAWQARFRPLSYDTGRAQTLLGIAHTNFATAISAARHQERSS